jgi:integral membrane protein
MTMKPDDMKQEGQRMSEQARSIRAVRAVRAVRDVAAARKALGFFKVMAITAGCSLFVLVVIIAINGGFGKGGASSVWSPIHGVIYFVFVLSIANLGFKVGWSLPRMILTMLSGFVPVLPFVVERKVAAEVEEQLAASVVP